MIKRLHDEIFSIVITIMVRTNYIIRVKNKMFLDTHAYMQVAGVGVANRRFNKKVRFIVFVVPFRQP